MAKNRNAPCDCGSGKKYKHCCLGRVDRRARRKLWIAAIVALVCIGALSGWLAWSVGPRAALLTAGGGVILLGLVGALLQPARARSRAGADRIDFGR